MMSVLLRWEMIALLPMYDPPRHDTKKTIESCIEKGIQVIHHGILICCQIANQMQFAPTPADRI